MSALRRKFDKTLRFTSVSSTARTRKGSLSMESIDSFSVAFSRPNEVSARDQFDAVSYDVPAEVLDISSFVSPVVEFFARSDTLAVSSLDLFLGFIGAGIVWRSTPTWLLTPLVGAQQFSIAQFNKLPSASESVVIV
jgi:hypothetical protein